MVKYFLHLASFLLLDSNAAMGQVNLIEHNILIKNHYFQPSIIEISSNQKTRLTVCNNDDTVEEFESVDLKREKLVPSHSCVHIILAHLKPGKYNFVGEFHQDTANGYIIVK